MKENIFVIISIILIAILFGVGHDLYDAGLTAPNSIVGVIVVTGFCVNMYMWKRQVEGKDDWFV